MGEVLTDERIAQIEARANAATDGPWRRGQMGNMRIYGPDCTPHAGVIAEVIGRSDGTGTLNTDFIAHARIDVLDLIESHRIQASRIEALEAEVERLKSYSVSTRDLKALARPE